MPLLPQNFIEDLKAQADIVTVIQDYVSLKKVGATYKGLCPFHGEKTPSFHVNRDKGFFHCFGCGEHGDVDRVTARKAARCRQFTNGADGHTEDREGPREAQGALEQPGEHRGRYAREDEAPNLASEQARLPRVACPGRAPRHRARSRGS